MEKRIFKNTQVRAAGGEVPNEISGIGAVVGVTTDLGYCEEEIAADAFATADLSEVLVCFNHDLDCILGKNTANTAEVSIDSNGNLIYRAFNLDMENPEVVPPVRYIMRGEVNKSSFMFEIMEEVWSDSEKYGSYGKRRITKIGKVYETGPVTLPAYDDTESECKALEPVLMAARSKFIESIKPEIDDDAERRAAWVRYYELTIK